MNFLLELLIFGVCAIILWNVLQRLITDAVAAGIKQAADGAFLENLQGIISAAVAAGIHEAEEERGEI